MNKKKSVIGVVIILLLSVGVTIAYLQSTDTFENIFNAGTYKTVTHEEFTSPDNWKPGDEIPKTITTKNEGTIPVRVRVKLEESWTSANNDNLPLTAEVNDGRRPFNDMVAIIKYDNVDDWARVGDYFYYIKELAPGESTSSLIESVTFNQYYEGNITCETNDNTKTCESSSDGYMGGKYTLKITTETVQADAYQNIWQEESYVYTNYGISGENSDVTFFDPYDREARNPIFFRYKALGPTVKESYIGFKYNGNTYYLRGGGATFYENTYDPTPYYEDNKTTLLNAFGSENCTEQTSTSPMGEYNTIVCQNSITVSVTDFGTVYVSSNYGTQCFINPDGASHCEYHPIS